MAIDDSQMTVTSFEPRPCPVCSADNRRILYSQNFAGFSNGGLLSTYDVVVCSGCGFAFADGIPGQQHFDKYYRQMSKYEYHHRAGLEPEWVLERYSATFDFLKPFVPSTDASILDIGCATGGLLGHFKRQKYLNVLGFDPSPACAAAAKRLHDVPVVTRTLADLEDETGRYDVIILTGVLEHVRDLRPALTGICRILNPGGIMYLQVPDATSFADWRNAPFQEFSTEHINFFSSISLANLVCHFGLKLEKCLKGASELSRDAIEPCLHAIFRAIGTTGSIVHDDETEPALNEYVRACNALDQRVRQRVADIAKRGVATIVWGVGTHTQRLLATSDLGHANIAAFVDSNLNYVGKKIRNVPVISPDGLKDYPEPILISSFVYQREIGAQIRNDLKLPNELIELYDV